MTTSSRYPRKQTKPTRRSSNTQQTRRALLAAGRRLFATRGYNAVSIEDIVTAARVTRGALYHHFDSKKDLFRAVLETVEAELVNEVEAVVQAHDDPWDLLGAAFTAFLDAATKPAALQIITIDGPSVLGWGEWREIDMRFGLRLVVDALEAGRSAGVIRDVPLVPLAQLILAAATESALQIAAANDKDAARADVAKAFAVLLDGLRSTR